MWMSELRPEEAVYLDTERLEEICHRLGYSGGEHAICSAMEDLAALLQQAGTLWRVGDFDTLDVVARQVNGLADRIGMAALARVAGDVRALAAAGHDPAALAATVARMRRLGERSLLAIWDRQDLTI